MLRITLIHTHYKILFICVSFRIFSSVSTKTVISLKIYFLVLSESSFAISHKMNCLKQFSFFFPQNKLYNIGNNLSCEGMVKLSCKLSRSFGREKKGKGGFLISNSISLMSISYLELLELKFCHFHILSDITF